jgi:hypothetical protein
VRPFLLLPLLCLIAAGQNAADVPQKCRDLLDKALKDRNPDTRKEAVIALSLATVNGPLFPELEAMLNDKDVEVRLATIQSLGDLKSKSTAGDLRRGLQDSVPEVTFAAAKALYDLKDPDGKATLLSVLNRETKTSSGFLKTEMRDAMRMLHTPRTTLMTGLKEGMGFIPVPGLGEGVASLRGLLSDTGFSGRASAALLLGKDKDPSTVAALREVLSDKDWTVRAAAVHSLALQNDVPSQKSLVPLLTDDKAPVRLRAAAAYLRLEAVKTEAGSRRRTPASKGK